MCLRISVIGLLAVAISLISFTNQSYAQSQPALYDVKGIAADDVLNLRRDPSSGAEVVDQIESSTTDIEVVEIDPTGQWARVNTKHQSGWAFLEYLSRQPNQTFTEPTRCFGTEPFWSLTFDETSATFTKLGAPGKNLSQFSRVGSTSGANKMGYLLSEAGLVIMGIASRTSCNDGMSDHQYGFSIDLMEMAGRNNRRIYSGCCSLK
jgi:uncharacterized membrane protein